jgi:hypothetical protein
MALFTNEAFKKHDDYMTPKHAWEDIKKYLPVDKVIWESFYGDGKSGSFLKELGFQVIHEEIDFFKNNKGDIIVSNPPFTMKKQVFKRLVELGKPFVMIMPSSTINTQYVRDLFSKSKEPLQIIIPRKRIQFTKIKDGKAVETDSCNFDCFYFCWKMGLPNDIVWLE